MMSKRHWTAFLAFVSASLAAALLTVAETPEPAKSDLDFGRNVRSLLSDRCFACHGPDENQRQAGLRLDTAEGLASVIEPGDVEASELIARLETDDPDVVMPPPEYHKPLSEEEKEILRRWVQSGAEVIQHWAFVPPVRPVIPQSSPYVGSTPIDFFIHRAASQSGLEINPIADRRTLLRRVCLDLTGLPPTRQQIDAFLVDASPQAFERLVDQLMESPEFGEHVGRYWLDLVRYADTHGLHLDNYREMWPYRDWVINAFNNNLPFDQFITHQLAGDLVSNATDAERIASGFNRLNVTTNEGGSIYEEVFARNCVDRTDAFGTIFLGLTTGCAVCHDHKFDPIPQKDYYSLLAFFNSLDGSAMDQNIKDHAPVIRVPSDEQKQEIADLRSSLQQLQDEKDGPLPLVDSAQLQWEQSLIDGDSAEIYVLPVADVKSEHGATLDPREDGSVVVTDNVGDKDTMTWIAPLPSGTQWQTLILEALIDDESQRVGLAENGNVVLSEVTVETTDAASEGVWLKAPLSHAFADIEQTDGPFAVSYAIDGKVNATEGWAAAGHQQPGGRTAWFVMPSLLADGEDAKIRIQLKFQSVHKKHQFRRVRLSLSNASPTVPDSKKIDLGPIHIAGPFEVESPNPGYGRKFASQQSAFKADEVFNHLDKPYPWQQRDDLRPVAVNDLPVVMDRASVVVMHQSIQSPSATKATLLLGADDGHVVFLNGKQVGRLKGARSLDPLKQEYELPLKKGNNDLYIKIVNHRGESQLTFAYRSPAIEVPSELVSLLEVPTSERTDEDQQAVRTFYRKVYCLHPDWLALIDQEKGTQKAIEQKEKSIPTTLVWKELATPRKAHILERGQYDQPGDEVGRATPSFLPSFPEDAPLDRLGLSQWLLQPEHPLTARVAVNRFWQQIFGTGLVKTSEDFGNQGEPPSHPELLDWLAVEFIESGWDVKRLLKTMVMSDTYRRSARVTDAMQEIDPENRLFARGPRHRLDAEVLRDQALALSGLLVEQRGGPSVKPPQPDGLWAAVGYSGSNTVRFRGDSGDKVYRRSVYTFWKRTAPPPQMSTFDAPSRESCTARRERTNTPLQALLLMNESQYVEAANHLAERVFEESNTTETSERIDWLFETVTARLPDETEKQAIASLVTDLSAYFNGQPALATELTGKSDAERAAWTMVASTLLNLDEVVTK
ncbi:MAG: PSD1 and planctomycete cytochrome C domain-containing protein [Planctomycetota bacterium]